MNTFKIHANYKKIMKNLTNWSIGSIRAYLEEIEKFRLKLMSPKASLESLCKALDKKFWENNLENIPKWQRCESVPH